MNILTYETSDIEAPISFKFMARIVINDAAGKPDLHPVVFMSSKGHAAVEALAQEWWDAELAKVEARRAHYQRLSASRKTKPENLTKEAGEAAEGGEVSPDPVPAVLGLPSGSQQASPRRRRFAEGGVGGSKV